MSWLQFASIIKIYATINTLNCASEAKRNALTAGGNKGEGGGGGGGEVGFGDATENIGPV